jgi:prolyl-tRNA editing enzyme YbaK/EbsC (Cys-tRNA(Pro) deacylase)
LAATWSVAGELTVLDPTMRPELLGERVRKALDEQQLERCGVVGIDPALADTAEFCATYGSPLQASANCVVVTGKRAGEQRFAGCVVLATARADVNTVVRRRLDVRKASFAPMEEAVALTGMERGGITPVGLPANWPILLDEAVAESKELVIGSGIRASKLLVPGELLTGLAHAEVLPGLGRAVQSSSTGSESTP